MLRILLADDHDIVRRGLKDLLEQHVGWQVCAEASNGREAVELALQLHPDIVVMDVAMPELNGIEATRRLVAANAHAKVIALSMHKDSVYVREILRAGARGYLLKDSGAGDLVTAIRAVAGGESYLSPAVSNAVLDDYRKHVTNPIDLLSSREREVLQMLAEGKTNKEIAVQLDISNQTVKNHVSSILRKLAVNDRTQAVVYAMRRGWIKVVLPGD